MRMRRKQDLERINLTIPVELKKRMQRHEEINWSVVATMYFEKFLKAQEFLRAFEEPGITEEEAVQRGLRIHHRKTVLGKES